MCPKSSLLLLLNDYKSLRKKESYNKKSSKITYDSSISVFKHFITSLPRPFSCLYVYLHTCIKL